MTNITRLPHLLKLTWFNWLSHDAARIGAALAFYTLLSLAPLVILSIAAGGLFFGGTVTEQYVIDQVRQSAGAEAARVVETMAEQARKPWSGGIASIVGLIILLVGASGVFAELRSALNTMWDIKPREASGFVGIIKDRLLSMGMVLAIGFLLVVSLVVSAILAALGKFFGQILPVPAPLLEVFNFLISFGGTAVLFALVLRYVPDVRLPWRDLCVGAAINAFLFTIGKFLIGLYLGRAAVGSLYGAGGSVVVVIVWAYYSAQLFLFGAEFTWVYAQCRNSLDRPNNSLAACQTASGG